MVLKYLAFSIGVTKYLEVGWKGSILKNLALLIGVTRYTDDAILYI
jgi:hypothetical protein